MANARRIASLPWYDLREIRAATDRFWQRCAHHLRFAGVDGVPDALERELDCFEQWKRPDLVISQACGYDVRIAFADHLQLVATPCYSAPGCAGASYSSFVVVREDSRYRDLRGLRGSRCVINTPTSHSGMNILRSMVAPLHENGRFFASVRVSGAHTRSLEAITSGDADIAAIDCVTYELLLRHRAHALAGTRILANTERVAAPPFVTCKGRSVEFVQLLRAALVATLRDPLVEDARHTMMLERIEALGPDAYQRIADLDELAREIAFADSGGGWVNHGT